MGYGKKGWFKTYWTMMCNSFKYASNSVSRHDHWISRGLSLLFAIVWYIFIIIVFIGVPLLLVSFLIVFLVKRV